jgi:DNA-binding transcriptional LysR family regulator
VFPPDWAITVRSVADLAGRDGGDLGGLDGGDLGGRPWVAGPPDTACDHALRRLGAEAGASIVARDVCVEFPSVLALVAAGRGAAIVPRLTLTGPPVATCSLPELGGRYIAALHQAGPAQPSPATNTVLDALAAQSRGSLSTRDPG